MLRGISHCDKISNDKQVTIILSLYLLLSNHKMKKLLSVNLWYEKYGNKTRAQLKSFRKAGFITHVATVISNNDHKEVVVINISDNTSSNSIKDNTNSEKFIFRYSSNNYRDLFKELFSFCINEKYDFIYLRRLMSKLLYAAPLFKNLSKTVPIVYEIPTYPLDTGNGFLYSTRDKIEMLVYKMYNKYIRLTLANLIDDKINLPANWQIFHNALDIDNYKELPYPELSDTIKLIIVANISEYHRYDRILDSIKNYDGEYKVCLTVISPESNAYSLLKEKASALNIASNITFLDSKSMNEILDIAKDFHIGIAQLSTSEKGSNLVNTLKSKDYCAMGLPFVSTCFDTSFEKDFPYAYVTKSMDEEINLKEVINWYIGIRDDYEYRHNMYNYAKNNLQYDKFVKQITSVVLN